MPGTLPLLPGVDLAASYQGGSVPARSGGDWFDVVVADDGRVGGVCGDSCAGPEATAAVAEIATVLRAALLDGADPATAVAIADRHAARRPALRGTAVTVLLLDPADGTLEVVRRGGPPALVRTAGGTVHDPGGAGAAPLGLGGAPPVLLRTVLGPGDAVVTATDGARLGEHTAAVATAGPTAAGLCSAVLGPGPGRLGPDDAAVLVMSRRPDAVAPLLLDLPADAGELAGVRERLADWLAALEVTAEGLAAVPLVASELVSNAVEHAYAGTAPGRVRLAAVLDGRGGLRVAVSDDGRWRTGTGPDGYGLAVVRDLAHTVDVSTGGAGTTVTAVTDVRLRAAVHAPAPRPSAAPVPPRLEPLGGDPPVLAVHGVLDGSAAHPLHAAVLRAAGPGGTVVLDLTGVTVLTTAGVRLLHEIVGLPGRPAVRALAAAPVADLLAVGGLAVEG